MCVGSALDQLIHLGVNGLCILNNEAVEEQ